MCAHSIKITKTKRQSYLTSRAVLDEIIEVKYLPVEDGDAVEVGGGHVVLLQVLHHPAGQEVVESFPCLHLLLLKLRHLLHNFPGKHLKYFR